MAPPRVAEAARTLALHSRDRTSRTTPLILPAHPDLHVELSTDTHWFYLHTGSGNPATWDVSWLEHFGDPAYPDEPEYQEWPRYACGTFPAMTAQLDAILALPHRVPDSGVQVRINEWALHYCAPTTSIKDK